MANHSPHLDNVFRALADPTRRAIIARLSQSEASVGELAQPFDMALPSLMKHIRVLETGGLVESGKHGRVRTCRLMPGAMKGAARDMPLAVEHILAPCPLPRPFRPVRVAAALTRGAGRPSN